MFMISLLGTAASAQWASASRVTQEGLGATYANGSGFAFFSNGTLDLDGPINEVKTGKVSPTLRITLNGEVVDEGVSEGVSDELPDRAAYPRLSSAFSDAEISVGDDSLIKAGIGESVPLFTTLSASKLELTIESVDGQSFSVYPRFSPSVSLPRETGLYLDADDPNNPNAENAGATILDELNRVF